MSKEIKGWRERAGLPASYEITNPSAVERALLEEVAELRKAARVRPIGFVSHTVGGDCIFLERKSNALRDLKGGATIYAQASEAQP